MNHLVAGLAIYWILQKSKVTKAGTDSAPPAPPAPPAAPPKPKGGGVKDPSEWSFQDWINNGKGILDAGLELAAKGKGLFGGGGGGGGGGAPAALDDTDPQYNDAYGID